MKKRISIIVSLILTVIFCVLLTACSGEAGKSAYEIACDYGFTGTEQEWLDSLVGANGNNGQNGSDGQNGKDGKDAADSDVIDIYDLFDAYLNEVDNDATFEEFLFAFLTIDYYDITNAAVKGIQSAVSIYCDFEKNTTGGWPPTSKITEYSTAGSGVVYRITGNDVYIITNYHVVYDRDSNGANHIAKNINVYTYGMEIEGYAVAAEFIGGSISKDIAVLKAKYDNFQSSVLAATLADSNDISLGEKTVAIGNPSAEGISITSGIVSVDSEEIEMEALDSTSKTNNFRVIRTDTPINSGNSGGGLYNARGQLLGIVNAKSIESGVENIGFAIPVNVARGIADCVIENNSKKCLLGVSVKTDSYKTKYNPEKNRIEIIETLIVDSVTAASLADGNISIGDKLLSARINESDELQLTRIFHLSDFLYNARNGDIIYLNIERNGELKTLELAVSDGNFTNI